MITKEAYHRRGNNESEETGPQDCFIEHGGKDYYNGCEIVKENFILQANYFIATFED